MVFLSRVRKPERDELSDLFDQPPACVLGGVRTARRIHLCEVRDGRITAVTTYCNGAWDDELRARHAADATMIRA
jgi:hypothetical protein